MPHVFDRKLGSEECRTWGVRHGLSTGAGPHLGVRTPPAGGSFLADTQGTKNFNESLCLVCLCGYSHSMHRPTAGLTADPSAYGTAVGCSQPPTSAGGTRSCKQRDGAFDLGTAAGRAGKILPCSHRWQELLEGVAARLAAVFVNGHRLSHRLSRIVTRPRRSRPALRR